MVKSLPVNAGDVMDAGLILGSGRMATHSSILAWEVPWTKEPGRLQSMGSQSGSRLSTHTQSRNREGEGEDGILGRRDGKSKGAGVGKQRPSSGNVNTLLVCISRVPGEQPGLEIRGCMVKFRGPGKGLWAVFFCGLTASGRNPQKPFRNTGLSVSGFSFWKTNSPRWWPDIQSPLSWLGSQGCS